MAKDNKRIWHGVAMLTLLLRTAMTQYAEEMRGTTARNGSVVLKRVVVQSALCSGPTISRRTAPFF
jgi:hypothetical protein